MISATFHEIISVGDANFELYALIFVLSITL